MARYRDRCCAMRCASRRRDGRENCQVEVEEVLGRLADGNAQSNHHVCLAHRLVSDWTGSLPATNIDIKARDLTIPRVL